MKKMLKIITALAMVSLAISFAGCSMDTEEDLLNASPSTGKTGGSGLNNGSGNQISTGGNNSGASDDSDDEVSLWASFDGASMQVWKDEWTKALTADLNETDEGLEITVGDSGWWGMCFCNDASVGANDGPVTFDMSKVAKITFEAKASKAGSIWVAQSPRDSNPANTQTKKLTKEFQTISYSLVNPGTDCYGVLDIGGDPNRGNIVASDSVITIKNIKFLDAKGNDCNPSRNE